MVSSKKYVFGWVVFLLPVALFAQDEDAREEVIVTGSYLFNEVDSPSPVDVITGEQLFDTPSSNLSDFFYYEVPQNFGAEATRYQDGGSGNHRSGARNTRINLRGLGSENTLVLLNGNRVVDTPNPDTSGWRNADISNLVPRIAVQRIQILHDGASATYGTDAVAGVVNFVTRNDFRGFELSVDNRMYEEDLSLKDYTIGGLFGAGNDTTSVIAAFEFHDEDPIVPQMITGIPIPTGALGAEFRGTDQDASPNSRGVNTFYPAKATSTPYASGATNWEYGKGSRPDPLCGDPDGIIGLTGLPATGLDPVLAGFVKSGRGGKTCYEYNNYPSGDSARYDNTYERQRVNVFAAVTHDLGSDLTISGEFSAARESQARNVGYTNANSSQWNGNFLDTMIPATNPGMMYNAVLDPGQKIWTNPALVKVERSIPYLQTKDTLYQAENFRIGGQIEGALNDRWSFRVSGSWSESKQLSEMPDGKAQFRRNALLGLGGPDCDATTGAPGVDNCQWYNPFMSQVLPNPVVDHDGDSATAKVDISNSQELLDWLVGVRQIDGGAKFSTVDALVTGEIGELGGGPAGIAIGFGHRIDDLDVDLDSISNEAAGWLTRSPADDFGGKTVIDSTFVEFALPFTDTFSVQLAARREAYKDSFTNTSPKIAALWQPTDRLSVRASFGQSFKAPTVVQTSSTQVAGNAICLQITPASNCGRGGGGGRFFPRVTYVTRGDETLQPQESDNLSFGFDFDVNDSLSVGASYLSYEFSNAITSPGRRSLIERQECHLKDATGNPVSQPDPDGGSRVLYIPISRVVNGQEMCFNVSAADPDGYIGISHSFNSFYNTDSRVLEAVDFNLNYRVGTGWGEFSVRPNLIYLLKDEATNPAVNDGLPVDQRGRSAAWSGQAEYRAVLNLGWNRGRHSAILAGRHISPINSLSIKPVANGPDILSLSTENGSTTTWDLIYGYRFGDEEQGRVTVNVQNFTAYQPSGTIRGPSQGRRYGIQLNYSFSEQ